MNFREDVEQEWKECERIVKRRRQGAVFAEVASPWLSLPSQIHIKLAWNSFAGQFPDKRVPYTLMYNQPENLEYKERTNKLLRKSSWTNDKREEFIEAMESLC